MPENLEYKTICAWCQKHLAGPAEASPGRVSHGICAACSRRLLTEHRAATADQVANNTVPDQSVWGLWVDLGGEG